MTGEENRPAEKAGEENTDRSVAGRVTRKVSGKRLGI